MLDAAQLAAVAHRGSRALLLAGPGCGKTHILAERVAHEHETFGTDFADMLCLTFTNRAARAMRQRVAERLGRVPEGLFVGNMHRFCVHMLRANGLIGSDTAILDEDDAAAFLAGTAGMDSPAMRSEVQALAVDRYMRARNYPPAVFRRLWFEPTPLHLRCVESYERFKRDNNMMDFDDCLLWAYDALRSQSEGLLRARYSWVQVDEVQDLTPLQLAIAGMLAPAPDATLLYLGDEQQAIFEFLGAGAAALSAVHAVCRGRVLRLHRNYRSPSWLTGLCNVLAADKLGIAHELLPEAEPDCPRHPDDLTLWRPMPADHKAAVTALVRRMYLQHPDETTAVLVRTNAELAEVHRLLEHARLPHMAVGARDCFRRVAFKTVVAHMAVALDPCRGADWARLLYQTGCVRRLDDASDITARMRDAAMTPACLLSPDGQSDVGRALAAIDGGERIVAVSATTRRGSGLRIEALAMSADGSRQSFSGDSLDDFAAFAAGSRLCYHGEPDADLTQCSPLTPVDTLRLGRLLFPARRSNSLAELPALFGIDAPEGIPESTLALLHCLVPMLREKLDMQKALLAEPGLADLRRRLATAYGPLYFHTQAVLRDRTPSADCCLTAELDYVYRRLVLAGRIEPIERWQAMLGLLGSVVTDPSAEPDLRSRLRSHLHELRTFNEGDIFDRGLSERLAVMTVHKAKGLEMDNVIVYNASTYRDSPLEKARIFYVAFSRARRRLAVFAGPHLSSALDSVEPLFTRKSARDARILATEP